MPNAALRCQWIAFELLNAASRKRGRRADSNSCAPGRNPLDQPLNSVKNSSGDSVRSHALTNRVAHSCGEILCASKAVVCGQPTARNSHCSTLVTMTVQTSVKPGRNEPCHCGSGRKYKYCCLSKDDVEASSVRAKAVSQDAPPSSEPVPPIQTRTRKPQTDQPWKTATARGFVPRARGPRKVGGS